MAPSLVPISEVDSNVRAEGAAALVKKTPARPCSSCAEVEEIAGASRHLQRLAWARRRLVALAAAGIHSAVDAA